MVKLRFNQYKSFLSLVLPFLFVLPWLMMLSTPLMEEVIIKQKLFPFDWILLVISYVVYFLGSKQIKVATSLFGYSSIMAFIVLVAFERIFNKDCGLYQCMGLINEYFGLACGYAEDGCELENYLVLFLILMLLSVAIRILWIWKCTEKIETT